MKKLILFITLLIGFSVSALAQKAYVIEKLPYEVWIEEFTGGTTDTLGTVTYTTWSYQIPINKADGVYYVGKLKVSDKTTGAAGVATIKLQGKYFDADTWTDITTVSWTGVGSTDTTAIFTSVSNKVYYRHFRYLVTCTSGKAKVDFAKLLLKR